MQTKLQVSEPGDAFEREADRIADAVMQTSQTETVQSVAAPRMMRRAAEPVSSPNAAATEIPQALQERATPRSPS